MNDHKLYFYLLFIFVACEIKKPSDKTENTILPIIQDTIIQDIRNANTPNIDFTQKMEAFPCFEDETIIKKHTFYFDLKLHKLHKLVQTLVFLDHLFFLL